jgi:hypothetical protein
VATWSQTRDDQAWRRIDVRDGAKGPLVVDIIKRRVASRTHRRQEGEEELLVVVRYRERDNHRVVKMDYYLSNAAPDTPLWQCAKVAKAEHRIEIYQSCNLHKTLFWQKIDPCVAKPHNKSRVSR